jgi:hypothetical protein
MAEVTPVQLLRSEVFNKRPIPGALLSGQPAVNINSQEPGLFFADDTGSALFKVGPCSVGASPPNSGATAPGALGNCVGELWLDTTSSPQLPGPCLRVWDGVSWIDCVPSRLSVALVDDVEPDVFLYPDGAMWWNSNTGLMYVLYNDGVNRQWTQVSGNTVG